MLLKATVVFIHTRAYKEAQWLYSNSLKDSATQSLGYESIELGLWSQYA